MAAYPGAIPSLTRPATGSPGNDGSATDATVVVDAISDEVEAIAGELGLDPSGASATVKARLDTLDGTVGGKADTGHTHSYEAAGAVSAHAGAADPHTGYALESSLGGAALLAVGTTAGTVAAGDDSRLSNARTPTAHAASHGTGQADAVTIAPAQVTGTAVVTNDARLSDARTPTAHKTSHATGGSDALAASDIGAAAASHTHVGTAVTIDASGFNGQLTTSDDTAQKVAQKVDDLTIPAAGIPATLLDAKGDLIVASASDTAARLAVGGTNGHVLTVDSAEATGMKWAAAGGSAAGILLSGTAAASGGSDGDWYLRHGSGTREAAALYGPKASGAWPADPDFILGSHMTATFSNLATGDANIAIDNMSASYPASAGGGYRIGAGTPSSAPSPNVSNVSNVAYSSGLKRGATAAIGFWTGEAFKAGFGTNLPLMAHGFATISAVPNGTSTSRMGIGFFNDSLFCGQYAYITPGGVFGIWGVFAGGALVSTTPSTAPAAGDLIAFQFLGQFAQAQLFSSAGVIKADLKAPRGGITYDTAFGNRMGVIFDSTDDTAGKITNFWGVC